MSWNNKVIWSEGLFLRPQHFQQQDRFLEQFVEQRAGRLRSYAWGFTELKLDSDLLGIGKVAIASARGVFADGTPFNIPESDDPPPPLDIVEAHRRHACLSRLRPVIRARRSSPTAARRSEGSRAIRFVSEARDTSAMTDTRALLPRWARCLRLLVDKDPQAYTCRCDPGGRGPRRQSG
jgi:type VI secretion system protein ImpJ